MTTHRSRPTLLARLRHDEGGFSMIEIMAALTILSFGFLALAGAASTGARLLAEGRQRQAAAEIASRQIEHLRNVPFDQLALSASIAQSLDPEHPDYFVHPDGVRYDHDADGSYESLVIQGSGTTPHTESFTVGATALTAYQYVTWVDDPDISGTTDYKRLTIAVAYNTPVNTGRPTQVRASALISPGSVTVSGSSVGAGTGTSSTPSPSPTPSPTGSCSGDTTPPAGTFTLVSGTGAATGYTASPSVTISMTPSDACGPIRVSFSNDNVTYGAWFVYQATAPTTTWQLTSGDGTKSVWGRFRDGVGNTKTIGPRQMVLDTTAPTSTGTLSRTVTCTGEDRTVNLSWGSSTDTNLLGYRVYRSVDIEPWTAVATASGTTEQDTHKKKLDSVRYRVVAYDKAGNEGPFANEITLSKNQCS